MCVFHGSFQTSLFFVHGLVALRNGRLSWRDRKKKKVTWNIIFIPTETNSRLSNTHWWLIILRKEDAIIAKKYKRGFAWYLYQLISLANRWEKIQKINLCVSKCSQKKSWRSFKTKFRMLKHLIGKFILLNSRAIFSMTEFLNRK